MNVLLILKQVKATSLINGLEAHIEALIQI
jgi:hypothetical protein